MACSHRLALSRNLTGRSQGVLILKCWQYFLLVRVHLNKEKIVWFRLVLKIWMLPFKIFQVYLPGGISLYLCSAVNFLVLSTFCLIQYCFLLSLICLFPGGTRFSHCIWKMCILNGRLKFLTGYIPNSSGILINFLKRWLVCEVDLKWGFLF